ncbi:unnamed protein product [Acanthoscelides obtectus]|uniref:DDE Tnp4 domain-containing protein n=1 Tax=Acanthoscelides obtectus TaxID=200917 RepID=A0A9P0KXG0_ACAOB|nr:unnamed protein product [Acanthoscelides obtectus]CAH1998884.1 unnamed protein product [Acanthoscelides obtectus]CAK1627064.1 Protein ANTAGONIST OF LIKE HETEROCHROMATIN PROTEIN 1 [Acanthoscelides obtectus]CAK1635862.1 Protein ANTAGONIST OF LIKE HETEROCHROMATIN PROTEIN 1 [Acanthoscelides obtectus]
MIDLKSQELSGQYKNFTRMSPIDFEYLITLVGPKVGKYDTPMRAAISVQDRLALTVRFLATGDSYTSLQYIFRISKQSISLIVPEVCLAIIEAIKENIRVPTTPAGWKEISKKFEELWNFPHCIGSMDGKHVIIDAPIHSGTEYRNYKSFFSIVMFAVVDAEYNFLFVDAGCQGRISDGGVFKDTIFFKKLEADNLGLPLAETLVGRNKEVPYVLVSDSAFPLAEHIMKPYPGDFPKGSKQRIFNYRLSRARRIVENVFGIIASVFRVLRRPILLQPENAEIIVMTIAHLHKFLRKNSESQRYYTPLGSFDREEAGQIVEGSWRNEPNTGSLLPLRNVPRRAPLIAKHIREEFSDYFCNEGKVPWQDRYC